MPIRQVKQFTAYCDQFGCHSTDSTEPAVEACWDRKKAEQHFRDLGWGRTSGGHWLCSEHIARNAGAKANVGRKRLMGGGRHG